MSRTPPSIIQFNRLANVNNGYQGSFKRVLCICSAGLLRSPTAAYVLSQPPFNFNTRAVGSAPEYALIPLDPVHLAWADEVVCMSDDQARLVARMLAENPEIPSPIQTYNLDIPDCFAYRDTELQQLIIDAYVKATGLDYSNKTDTQQKVTPR